MSDEISLETKEIRSKTPFEIVQYYKSVYEKTRPLQDNKAPDINTLLIIKERSDTLELFTEAENLAADKPYDPEKARQGIQKALSMVDSTKRTSQTFSGFVDEIAGKHVKVKKFANNFWSADYNEKMLKELLSNLPTSPQVSPIE